MYEDIIVIQPEGETVRLTKAEFGKVKNTVLAMFCSMIWPRIS